MAESDISISEMTNGTFSAGAIFPAIQPDGQSSTGYSNVKMSGSDIGDGIGQLQFPLRLDTTNKTIFGAINEAAAAYVNILPTDTASGALASFPDGANGIPLQSLILNVTPAQSGSGDPSPSNVRPITGHTEFNLVHTGKNLLDNSSFNDGSYYEKTSNGISVLQSDGRGWNDSLPSIFLPKGIYFLSVPNMSGVGAYRLKSTNYDSTSEKRFVANGIRIDLSEDDTLKIKIGFTASSYPFNCTPQIEVGSSATTYEAYTAATRTASFGQTIYGATIDTLTGEGNVTDAITDLGDYNYTYNSTNGYFYTSLPSDSAVNITGGNIGVCSRYKLYQGNVTGFVSTDMAFTYNNSSFGGSKVLFIRDTTTTDPTTFKTNVTGQKLVYKLATPEPITITPIENITTLYGANNIFQDAGDTTATYKADIKLYIDKKTS